jgi:bacteriocin biosynthesis cyclodehydratase domain-containing protein
VSADERRDPRDAPGAGGQRLEGELSLRGAFELFPAASGDWFLLRPGGGTEFVIRRPAAPDQRLLERLAAGDSIRAGPADRQRLAPLVECGAVVPRPDLSALDPGDRERFARQLPYLAELGDPAALQRRLRDACVVVLGCGGLGTWAIGALACAGVGRLVLVDPDTVALSNLNRQVLFRAADVGQLKVEAAARWVRAFDPAIAVEAVARRVESPADLSDHLAGADALVQAADWPPYELGRWVNRACLAAGVPHITAAQQPPLLRIGPAYGGRGRPCFACHETQIRREYPRYDELTEHRRRHGTDATTLGPASGIVGTLLAQEIMHLLLGVDRPATTGTALLLDLRTLELRREAVTPDPECAVCGSREDR